MTGLILDNYDSFTFNLFQMLSELAGSEPKVVPNDGMSLGEIEAFDPDYVVISPGPGRPERDADFGVCGEVLEHLAKPTLGVCLGLQGMVHAAGGRIVNAPEPVHGRLSPILHQGEGLFDGIPQRFSATRYHSLVAAAPLPSALARTAWTEDGLIMGLRHRSLPFWGVQFHPESIGSSHGRKLLSNFLALAATATGGRRRSSPSPAAAAKATPSEPAAARYRVRWRRLDRDVDPERTFLHLFASSPHAFWLDSSLDDPTLCRFSFMGAADGPAAEVVTYDLARGEVEVRRSTDRQRYAETIFAYLERELGLRACAAEELPFDFVGGWIGYFGYELQPQRGGATREHTEQSEHSEHPDALFFFVDRLLAFDHWERQLYLVEVVPEDDETPPETWFDETERRLGEMPATPERSPQRASSAPLELRLDRDRETYLADVERCLAALHAGESYEICLTNKIRASAVADAIDFYRELRRRNPAPYSAFLATDGLRIVCSSPERFLKIDRDRVVTAKPIKGTIHRDPDPEKDRQLAERLASSEKDRAENLMIVDLLRNDLGKVCRVGSVTVPRLMAVESYATVHQLVSTVQGTLRDGRSAIDCIAAAFPGGSMTGAPKLRTMEILDRLETRARGVYSGALGFLSINGTADLNIAIRTAVESAGEISIGIGGAVVTLSEPQREYDEALLKARALIDALTTAACGGCGPGSWRWSHEPEPAPLAATDRGRSPR